MIMHPQKTTPIPASATGVRGAPQPSNAVRSAVISSGRERMTG